LFFGDAFIGTLALYHTEANRYTEDHRRLIERVAEQAGAVIHNSIVFEQTQEDSLTDPLTGLPNRRSLFVHLTREIARAERLKGEVAMIVMDIDEFKTSATRRRTSATALCVKVAAALQAGLRSTICAYYAATSSSSLAECSRETAVNAGIFGSASAIEFGCARAEDSAAVTQAPPFPPPTEPPTDLARRADHSMYRDKAAHRGHRSGADGRRVVTHRAGRVRTARHALDPPVETPPSRSPGHVP
jgi:GGDEF domain-containing protein